jgi:hypothetical protein
VEYSNINNDTGVLAPTNLPTNLDIPSDAYFYWFKSDWLSSAAERSYAELQSTLYWSEVGDTAKKYFEGETTELGIEGPAGSPTVAVGSAGILEGTYTYYITYYNDSIGIESKPLLLLPAELVVPPLSKVNLAALPTSADPQVDLVRIYRIGGTLTARTLVTEVANGTVVYIDNIADNDVDGYIMDSETYDKAPDGLIHIAEHNSGLVGAVDAKVYFTPIATPNAWPILDYFLFPNTVTGISSTPIGLLVFTERSTYIVTGTDYSTYNKQLFDGSQGCVNHHTIAKLKGTVTWVSSDGICTIVGGRVTVISLPVLSKLPTTVNAVVHDDIYYLQLEDKILAMDARFGLMFKEFDLQFDRLGMFEDTLYGVSEGFVYSLFTADDVEDFSWLSAEFSEGAMSHKKKYYGIYFNSVGRLTVELLIDGRSVQFLPLVNFGITEIFIPQEHQDGYSIQFHVKGRGVLKEIEWKVEGRSNER